MCGSPTSCIAKPFAPLQRILLSSPSEMPRPAFTPIQILTIKSRRASPGTLLTPLVTTPRPRCHPAPFIGRHIVNALGAEARNNPRPGGLYRIALARLRPHSCRRHALRRRLADAAHPLPTTPLQDRRLVRAILCSALRCAGARSRRAPPRALRRSCGRRTTHPARLAPSLRRRHFAHGGGLSHCSRRRAANLRAYAMLPARALVAPPHLDITHHGSTAASMLPEFLQLRQRHLPVDAPMPPSRTVLR